MDEPRVVARYAAQSAEVVHPLVEEVAADDPDPAPPSRRLGWFAHGASLTTLQRVTAMAAHRATREVSDEAA